MPQVFRDRYCQDDVTMATNPSTSSSPRNLRESRHGSTNPRIRRNSSRQPSQFYQQIPQESRNVVAHASNRRHDAIHRTLMILEEALALIESE